MKIHSNPNSPLRKQRAGHFFDMERNITPSSPDLLSQLERENARELERLREKQRLRTEKASNPAPCGGAAHVHRVSGHVRAVKRGVPAHRHRFHGVTGEAIPTPGGHVHRIKGFTTSGRPSHDEAELLAGVSEVAD